MTHSTIAAIATPAGSGGIGIIKISGQDALSIAGSLFRPSDRDPMFSKHGFSGRSHHLYHGHIADPETGRVLDEVLLAVMLAPHSYTREDVVEIQAHAGPVVLGAVLNLALKKGARLADPGEFTKRAYVNGRIDLTQAEAVIDIINAKTDKALEIATAQIRGGMRLRIDAIREALLGILVQTEAGIDFPEDVGDSIDTDMMSAVLHNAVIDPLNQLLGQYETGHVLKDGLRTLIVGRPNVGKSSLMNCLLQKDRVIVTPVPGTTRDAVEDLLNIRGMPVIVTDTAGLHETDDPIEQLGMESTCRHIGDADLILFMVDLSQPLTTDDHRIYERICHKSFILVANKSDLTEEGATLELPDSWRLPVFQNSGEIRTSATCNKGLDALRDLIADIFMGKHKGDTIVPNLRHKLALEESLRAASAAAEGIDMGMPFELISIDIRESADLLGEIIGITLRDDVLDQIFSRFCIGK